MQRDRTKKTGKDLSLTDADTITATESNPASKAESQTGKSAMKRMWV